MEKVMNPSLSHACECMNKSCKLNNCKNLKRLLEHAQFCQYRVSGGCSVCSGYWRLITYHSKHCKLEDCNVPHCMQLKIRSREISKKIRRSSTGALIVQGAISKLLRRSAPKRLETRLAADSNETEDAGDYPRPTTKMIDTLETIWNTPPQFISHNPLYAAQM